MGLLPADRQESLALAAYFVNLFIAILRKDKTDHILPPGLNY